LSIALLRPALRLGLDTLVSQAFGAGKREDCHRSLVNSIYLSIALTPLLLIPVWLLPRFFRAVGANAEVVALSVPYINALAWGLLPLLLFFALCRCVRSLHMVRPLPVPLIS